MIGLALQRAPHERESRPRFARSSVVSAIHCCALAACSMLREAPPAHARAAPQSDGASAASQSHDGGTPAEPAADEGETPIGSGAPARADASVARASRPLHGSLSMRHRARATGGEQDHDLWAVLALDYADSARPWITGHVLGRLDVQLDGHEDDGSIFHDLDDTYDGSLVGRLYEAYVDLALPRTGQASGTLRIGRQSDPRLPEVLHLDGLSWHSRPLGAKEVELGLYGGVPVHWYESSAEGDRAFGSFAEARPWRGGRARIDWMHLEDELRLGPFRDDLLGLGLWQALAQRWLLEGQYTRLEGEDRDLRLRTQYTGPDSKTVARLDYYELRETQTAQALELDPFSEALQEYFPFRQAGLRISRSLAEHAVVEVGFDLRRLKDQEDVGEFNREWERTFVSLTLRDLATDGLSLSLSGDEWNGDGRDIRSLGADLTFSAEPAWSASIGTYYSLFKYELFDVGERDDVRTYYVRGTRRCSEQLDLQVSYEFEDDDLEQYHILRWGGLWRF
jgi:hypothetical protein